jgi:hypothetical protein
MKMESWKSQIGRAAKGTAYVACVMAPALLVTSVAMVCLLPFVIPLVVYQKCTGAQV